MSEFKYPDAVLQVGIAAKARLPRLQRSAIDELLDVVSLGVTRGDWVQDGDEVITSDGKTPEQFVDWYVSTRPHMEVPPEVVEVADRTWLDGDLTAQGQRYNQIRAVFQKGKLGDQLADAAMKEEAALYGAKPGSTKKGIAPGTKPDVADTGTGPRLAGSSTNPWDRPNWRGSEEARQKRIQDVIKTSTSLASSLAKSAGVTLTGQKLRPVKAF